MRTKLIVLARALGSARAQLPVMAGAAGVALLTAIAALAESLRWSMLGLVILTLTAVLLLVDSRFRLAQLERVQRINEAQPDPSERLEHTLRRVLAAVEMSRLESLDRYAELSGNRPGSAPAPGAAVRDDV